MKVDAKIGTLLCISLYKGIWEKWNSSKCFSDNVLALDLRCAIYSINIAFVKRPYLLDPKSGKRRGIFLIIQN